MGLLKRVVRRGEFDSVDLVGSVSGRGIVEDPVAGVTRLVARLSLDCCQKKGEFEEGWQNRLFYGVVKLVTVKVSTARVTVCCRLYVGTAMVNVAKFVPISVYEME